MIGIYDKGLFDSTFIQDVSGCLEQQTTACTKLNELRNCEVAIVHVTSDHWNVLINNYSCPDSVRIRVSTVGFSDPPAPTISNSNVYAFYLLPPTGDLEAEWKEILTDLSDREIVKSLVRGENPNGLRRFFVHEVQEHLSALTILCEGYLAVHAENTDCSEDISSALELMGWSEFQKSDRYSALIREDLSEQISIVRRRQWWSDVFEPEFFDNDMEKEWKDTTGEEEIPKALNDLLEAIHKGDTVVPPKIVADAYCILVKKK